MKLPGAERALIDERKLRDYLPSASHPVGRHKAAFLLSLGYAAADWRRQRSALREIAGSAEAVLQQASEYGRKFEVRGTLLGPEGRSARIVTIWMERAGEEFPRFVTAYPEA